MSLREWQSESERRKDLFIFLCLQLHVFPSTVSLSLSSPSPSHYYTVNRGVPADYYSVYSSVGGGPGYVEEYPLYPPGVRPDSICSVSAVGYDRMGPPRWTNDEKRRSLRDGPLYGPPPPRDPYGPPPSPAYYGQMDAAQTAMRRLSIQPRSRSVPRSPSSSTGGPYSPSPHSFASPICSPSARFDRGPGRLREDVIYADPSVYGLRRSLSSPKVREGRGCVCVCALCVWEMSGYFLLCPTIILGEKYQMVDVLQFFTITLALISDP